MTQEAARNERMLIWKAYFGLLFLLALTMAVAVLDLGWGNVVANLTVAVFKTCVILWIFMNLRESTPLARLFAIAAVLWLGFLITFGLGDWLTRSTPI